MIKTVTIFKQSMTVILNIIAGILMVGSYIISIYKYEWIQEPDLSKMVNSDAVLTVIVLSVLSLICATAAFIFKRKFKSLTFLFYTVLVILNIYRLLKVIPVYSG